MAALRLVITGRVQGVGFRAWTRREARRRGLRGWVRNRSDGSVEALLQGEAAAVARVVDWARRGPPSARVDELHENELEPLEGEYARFEERPSV